MTQAPCRGRGCAPPRRSSTVAVSGSALQSFSKVALGVAASARRRLRLFKAIELLGGGLGVTQAAMELGYGSASAFVYAFRTEMGCSPQAYMRGHATERAASAAGGRSH